MEDKRKLKYKYNESKPLFHTYDFFKTLLYSFVIVSIVFVFIVRDANVNGSSMNNTLQNGDKVLITNLMYTPKAGDIVTVYTDKLQDKRIIKRVIATEGQTLKIDYVTGQVCVDGVIQDEKYISSPTIAPTDGSIYDIPYVIPEGYIFVMGDNRGGSLDSRSSRLGLIPVKDVIGKAQLIFYPFNRFKYLY